MRTKTDIYEVYGLTPEQREQLAEVASVFAFQAPEYYLSLIDWDDPADPIRRIIIPDPAELRHGGEFDPCDEAANFVAPGLQHKYSDTVLLLATDTCAGLCRYCFRKRLFVDDADVLEHGADETVPSNEVARNPGPALEYIRSHPGISNVLLTGGDVLTLGTTRLAALLEELREIPHIKVIRLGSRMPVFNPYRILNDPELVKTIRRVSTNQRRVYLVTHFDHPREITDLSSAAVAQFINHGIPVVNQNPILSGVNDDPGVLRELFSELNSIGVAPYYLFLVRPTFGNRDFQVPIARTFELLTEAEYGLSGLEKRVRLVMSHASGKIEVVGMDREYIYMRYQRARNYEDHGRFMVFERDDDACWLEDLDLVSSSAA